MRNLLATQEPLVSWLISASGRTDALDSFIVSDMEDGGMGSMRFESPKKNRRLGGTVAEGQFLDADGVLVVASLNIDEDGNLFELDIWRTDFDSLKRWPQALEITTVQPNRASETF
jgi:hypothetical protein